ncbi:hypothetical protein QVM57_34545 [Pseudomonas aeruginosa]
MGAVVEAPDWKKDNRCGHGLHGWLFGQGDHDCSSTVGDADAKWLVVEVDLSDLIALGGKVKFPRCTVRHIGDKASATQFLIANEPRAAGVAVIGATLQAGDKELCQVGAYGTATAGEKGEIRIRYWDEKTERYRTVIGYIGEDGLEPNVPYKLSAGRKLVRA